MIRWKGFIGLLIFIAGMFCVSYFVMIDEWIEEQVESILTNMNKAKVEIDSLKLSLSDMEVSWNRIQITDRKNPMTNLFETKRAEFTLEFIPLLSKKVIIERFEITEFALNTKREITGALPPKPKKKKKAKSDSKEKEEPGFFEKQYDKYSSQLKTKLKQKVSNTPKLDLSSIKNINTDNIVESMEITSIKKIDSVRTTIDKQYSDLDKNIKNINVNEDIKSIETTYKSINFKKLKKLKDFTDAYEKLDKIVKTIESSSKEIKTAHKSLKAGLKSIKTSVPNIQTWVNEDYKKASDLAKLPDLNAQNIGQILFGDKVANQLTEYLDYISIARSYLDDTTSTAIKEEEPERFKGQTIKFSNKYARPDFWLKKTKLSGYTNDGTYLNGNIDNITSNQSFIQKPTTFKFEGENSHAIKLKLDGEFNYVTDISEEKVNVAYTDFPLKNIKLKKSGILPEKVKKGNGNANLNIHLIDGKLNGLMDFVGKNIEYDYTASGKPKNTTEKLIRDVVKNTNTVDFLAKINDGDFSIKSNLDKLLMKNLKKALNREIQKAKDKIKKKIDREVAKYRKKLDALVATQEKKLNAQLKKYEDRLNKEKKKLNDQKKKIEKEQKKKLKKGLEDKLKKGLKGLF